MKNEMAILVKNIIEAQKSLIEIADENIGEEFNDSIILRYISKVSNNYLFINSAVAKRVADYSQLLNEKENFEKFTLMQIREIYEGLTKINPLDISFYESLAFYLNNVLDCPDEAKQLLNTGITQIEQKIAELKNSMNGFE